MKTGRSRSRGNYGGSIVGENRPSGVDWLDGAIVAGVVATIAFAAATYGGVEPGSEAVILLAAAVLTGLTLWQFARGRSFRAVAVPLVILASFGGLIVLQLAPLPHSLVGAVAPERLARTTDLLAESPDSLSISYYPYATAQGLGRFLVGVAVFTAVAVTATTKRNVKLLLLGLFCVGVAEAALSIAQIATGAEGIYWSEVAAGEVHSGSFLNHSNFSQLLNLTAGAGLGLLLVRMSEGRRNRSRHGHRGRSAFDRFNRLSDLAQSQGWLLAGLTLHVIAIAASLSRGGIVAMLVAAAVVIALQGSRYNLGERTWALVVIPPLVFAGLVLIGFDAFYERLAALEDRDSYTDRWELNLATLRLAADHLALGAGLDAYGWVFPAYDTTASTGLAEQADNDYAQLLAEMGIVGVAMVAAFLGTLIWRIRRGLTNVEGSLRYALHGVLYGLIAVAIQSCTDFGQRLPAVFCASAALCGVAVGVAARKRGAAPNEPAASRRWIVTAAVGIVAAGGWFCAVRAAINDYRAERWWAAADQLQQELSQPNQSLEPQTYVDLVAALEQAAAIRPESVRYAYWLNAFRWEMATRLSGTTGEAFAQAPAGKQIAAQIADELAAARRLCPTFGPPYTLEGQIRLALGDRSGERLVRVGADLAPHNAGALLLAAAVGASGGEVDAEATRATLRRVVDLDPARFPAAARLLVDPLQRPAWAIELAGKNRGRLTTLAAILDQFPAHRQLAQELAAQAANLREVQVERGEASAGEVAALATQRAREGDYPAAVSLYRQALATNYANLRWRLAMSAALVELGEYRQAEREVRVCLRLQPGNEEAKRLAEKISRLIPPSGGGG